MRGDFQSLCSKCQCVEIVDCEHDSPHFLHAQDQTYTKISMSSLLD